MRLPKFISDYMKYGQVSQNVFTNASNMYRQNLIEMGFYEGSEIWKRFYEGGDDCFLYNVADMCIVADLKRACSLEFTFSTHLKMSPDDRKRNLVRRWTTAKFKNVGRLEGFLCCCGRRLMSLCRAGFWHRKGVKHAFFDFSTEDGKISRVMFTFEDVEFVENASGINQ